MLMLKMNRQVHYLVLIQPISNDNPKVEITFYAGGGNNFHLEDKYSKYLLVVSS